MLDALGLPGVARHVGARRQRRVHVAAPDHRAREQVLVARIHLRGTRGQRVVGRQHRRQRLVGDLDQRRRGARGHLAVGRHRGEHVADVAHLFALGHERRPVGVEDAVPALAGHVLRGRHRHHAGLRERLRDVDADHPRARVRRQVQGAEQHAGGTQVVHVGPRAQRHLARLPALGPMPEPAVHVGRGQRLAAPDARHQLDRLDHLEVAGAAAQVLVERAHDLLARGRGMVVEQVLRAHHDSGRAEPALEAVGVGEGAREQVALGGRQALERVHAQALGALSGDVAGRARLAVHQHHARAALAGGLAAALGAGHAERAAQQVQQGLAGARVHRARAAIQRERHLHRGSSGSGPACAGRARPRSIGGSGAGTL